MSSESYISSCNILLSEGRRVSQLAVSIRAGLLESGRGFRVFSPARTANKMLTKALKAFKSKGMQRVRAPSRPVYREAADISLSAVFLYFISIF
jgi:hypothetical protein